MIQTVPLVEHDFILPRHHVEERHHLVVAKPGRVRVIQKLRDARLFDAFGREVGP